MMEIQALSSCLVCTCGLWMGLCVCKVCGCQVVGGVARLRLLHRRRSLTISVKSLPILRHLARHAHHHYNDDDQSDKEDEDEGKDSLW